MARPPNYHQMRPGERLQHRLEQHGVAVQALTEAQRFEAEHAAAELEAARLPVELPAAAAGEG